MPAQDELLLVLGINVAMAIQGESYVVQLRGWGEDKYLIKPWIDVFKHYQMDIVNFNKGKK